MARDSGSLIRLHLAVTGQVQGVGFRPYVYRLATDLGLSGSVANDPKGVTIEVEGAAAAVEAFVKRLPAEVPPLARIDSISREALPFIDESDFVVLPSASDAVRSANVTPDAAVCADCLREMADPSDRRYRYPFINCTNCGPRYTIIFDVPYDRRSTTMAGFRMCPDCAGEYTNPTSRRFHAEPNACPRCGPRTFLMQSDGRTIAQGDEAITRSAGDLRAGRIVAVKGLGGFHLACLATSDSAVKRLRERKRREQKPLAIMVRSLDEARACAHVSEVEAEALRSIERPIGLLRKRAGTPIAAAVAPRSPYLGIMLPYTPLHVLLLDAVGAPLVMTSGNVSEEPICRTGAEAQRRLGDIADLILTHNRPIYTACDDSVVREDVGCVRVLRRSRGYVPVPVELPVSSPVPILAVGPELKNTLALVAGRRMMLSHHIGDLKNARAEGFFRHAIETLSRTMDIRPQVVAHDAHPAYLSTRYAVTLNGLRRIAVQHHHAHVAACMAEHGLTGPVIGLVCDGTGYGADGTTWGCEFLVADERTFRRAGHLANVALPGGDRAAEEPWRMALSYLHSALPDGAEALAGDLVGEVAVAKRRVVLQMLRRGVNAPPASSLGRLFDAVSALAGVCLVNRYEGQAAIELEAAMDSESAGEYDFTMADRDEGFVVEAGGIIRGVVADVRRGVASGAISARFHRTVAAFLVAAANRIREAAGLTRVALTGGSFQNAFLVRAVHDRLAAEGFEVFLHERVPPNDGGIALGQAYVAAARLAGKHGAMARPSDLN